MAMKDRILSAMAEKGYNQSSLARQIGVSQGAISLILKGTTTKSRYLHDIAEALDVSLPWLEGETDDPQSGAGRSAVIKALREEGLVRVQEFDLTYSMGGGTYLDAQGGVGSKWRHFDLDWLREITPSEPDNLFIARGIGDSMMPTLLDADTLLIDTAQKAINRQDRLWAIAYGDLGMIKRVRKLPSGQFLIISDNPAVENFEAADSEFHVIGRVAWIGRKG